jgi:small subunit ribosomal protein S5
MVRAKLVWISKEQMTMAKAERQPREKEESEFIEKLVAVNRVAKTQKGGRRFGFAALVVIGDGRGRVGTGHAKSKEVPDAVKKATDKAKRNMIRVPLRDGRTLHHDIRGHFGAGRVTMRTAPTGTGIIAGGPMRAVFECLGVQDVVAKVTGSNNPYNMVNATLEALKFMQSPRQVASRRGKKISDVVSQREGTNASASEGSEE